MSTSRGAWKNNERRAARALGGQRIPCSGAGEIKGDVMHNRFFVEVKMREKLSIYPWMRKAAEQAKPEGKTPLLVVRQKYSQQGDMVVMWLRDFETLIKKEDGLKCPHCGAGSSFIRALKGGYGCHSCGGWWKA